MFGSNEEDKLGDVNRLLWWFGWHPWLLIILGLPLFLVGGFLIWIVGLLYVNSKRSSVHSEYVELVDKRRSQFASQVGSEVDIYSLVGGTDSFFLYRPDKEYRANHLMVGNTSVTIQEGIRLDTPSRVPTVRDTSQEIYYDQISSVTYSTPFLIINTSDGDSLKYLSSRKPDDALQDLQDRIRAYKRPES